MTAYVLRGDARSLPLPDGCVDLIVTSPPYFGLRSYTDGGQHYPGQIGSEPTPAAWLDALLECTAEWVRVLKPDGNLFVNLGDKYNHDGATRNGLGKSSLVGHGATGTSRDRVLAGHKRATPGQPKSLLGLPWRYAIGATDQLGLILRAEIIWAKPNGLPESVTDRVRRAHEQVFHFTRQPRYYAAVDEIREPTTAYTGLTWAERKTNGQPMRSGDTGGGASKAYPGEKAAHPLGKLPGSVWDIPSAPLQVPERVGVDHFACVDDQTEILTEHGWLPHGKLIQGDMVASYDLGTNTARWTQCTAVNRYDYDGDLIAVESRDISMRLTPNHRTIVQRMHTRAHKRSPVSVIRADELSHRHFIPRSAAWDTFGDLIVGDRCAAMMGWVTAEGWIDGNRVRLSQSLDANPANVARIDQLIPDAARSERTRTWRGRSWTEVTWTLSRMASLILDEMPDKLLPTWLILASEAERRACLNAFIDGDGHRRPDGRIAIFQKYRHNLDVLQAVAVTLGYKTTLRESGGRFALYLTEGGRSVTLRGTSGVGSKVNREHYRGVVWCPTTGTGTFIARRNGSVFVTGNSFPPALVRPVVLGWSPPGVCTACGQGRRPVARQVDETYRAARAAVTRTTEADFQRHAGRSSGVTASAISNQALRPDWRITGYACACPQPDAPTRPSVVLDPFGGTGTTALVASCYGRVGVTMDLSADYCRLAAWRVNDPGERARARAMPKPPPIPDGMEPLFTM
jgi:DNA modification methylase